MSDLLRLITMGDGSAWKQTVERLRRVIRDDKETFANEDGNLLARDLYARYMVNSNELTVCHDSIVQPQVRILIKKMLMCVYGRILELKKILIDEDLSIHTPIIEQLVALRTTYDEFEMIVPRCFRDERQPFLNHVDDKIDEISRRTTAFPTNHSIGVTRELIDLEVPTKERSSIAGRSFSGNSSDFDYDVTKFIDDEKQSIPRIVQRTMDGETEREIALKLVQRHIRAMRDRVVVNELLSAQRTRENIISGKYIVPSKETARQAAVKIQRYWRFYRMMRRTKVRTQKLRILIGMLMPSDKPNYSDVIREREDKTREKQAKAEMEFRSVTNKLQKSLNERYKAEIVEEMEHELRTYVWTYFKTHKDWPPTLNLSDSTLEKIVTKDVAVKTGQPKRKDLTKTVLEPSDFTTELAELFNDFDDNWSTDNGLDERPKEQLIKSEIFANIRAENKKMVDETIGKEMELLKKAHSRDMGQKYKAPKKKSKKSFRARSKRKKHPNLNEIFEELVKNGMIKKSVSSKFSEFQGEVSFVTGTLVGERYCLGDIRQIIKELFVIGLIATELRTSKKIKFMKSLLIAGPSKSGKTLLTNAVCTETGSLKIELTLKNVSENCESVADVNRLVDLIIEFAKTYQPVVVEVDSADIPFYKKIPKDLKLLYKPALMAKLIKRLMKKLKATERVIIIGKATTPWLTNARRLTDAFQAIVFTVPDHNTVFASVNGLLMSHPWVGREFSVTPLAAALAGCPGRAIADVVAAVMTDRRTLALGRRPLEPAEFAPAALDASRRLNGAGLRGRYHDWYAERVPLGVARRSRTDEQEAKKGEPTAGSRRRLPVPRK